MDKYRVKSNSYYWAKIDEGESWEPVRFYIWEGKGWLERISFGHTPVFINHGGIYPIIAPLEPPKELKPKSIEELLPVDEKFDDEVGKAVMSVMGEAKPLPDKEE